MSRPLIFTAHNISLSHFPCLPFIVPVLSSVDLTNCVWLWGHWVFEWLRCGKESHDSSVGDSANVCILSHFRQILDFVFISCLILTELDTHYLRVVLNVLQKLIDCWWTNKDNGIYFWKYTVNKTFCNDYRLRRNWNMLFSVRIENFMAVKILDSTYHILLSRSRAFLGSVSCDPPSCVCGHRSVFFLSLFFSLQKRVFTGVACFHLHLK